MLDGFNASWVAFQDRGWSAMRGATTLAAIIVEAAKTPPCFALYRPDGPVLRPATPVAQPCTYVENSTSSP